MNKDVRKRLLNIATAIAVHTDIRLAYHEMDNSTDTNKDASHFLKYEEKRVGRDIELYAFIGKVEGTIAMLCDFIAEVLFPLNQQNSIAAQAVMDWGCELTDKENWDDWRELFVKQEE